MTVLVALLALAGISWLYRVSFTALIAGDRLPAGLRARVDAVSPAAFAALLATQVTGTSAANAPAIVAAVMAAAVTAWRTGSHVAAIVVASGTWWLVSLW